MYTFEQIRSEYLAKMTFNLEFDSDFEQYLRENYYQVYDENLELLGWERDER